jgi:glycosyltransferase involved in cell wall biosynthesis
MSENVKIARPMKAVAFGRSPVSIIIPFHGQYDKLGKLIESIQRMPNTNPYEICVVDDASPNKAFIDTLKRTGRIVTVRSESQVGFGGALELGVQGYE